MSELHHEVHLEDYVVARLKDQGWKVGTSDKYDQDHAMYPEDIEAWLKATQPAKWDKLFALNGDKTCKVVMDRLEAAIAKSSTIDIIRSGFSIAGCGHLDLSEAAPEDQRNADVLHRYVENRFHPVRRTRQNAVPRRPPARRSRLKTQRPTADVQARRGGAFRYVGLRDLDDDQTCRREHVLPALQQRL